MVFDDDSMSFRFFILRERGREREREREREKEMFQRRIQGTYAHIRDTHEM